MFSSLARSALSTGRKMANPSKLNMGVRSMSSEATFDLTGSFKVSFSFQVTLI
jgi:hypothetical protein